MTTSDSQTPMGILAYFGPLVIVSYLVAKSDQFVKFHIKQGLVLLVIEAVVWVVGMMFWQLWMLLSLVNLATLILSIIGIINVLQHKQEPLPVVGRFSSYFSI